MKIEIELFPEAENISEMRDFAKKNNVKMSRAAFADPYAVAYDISGSRDNIERFLIESEYVVVLDTKTDIKSIDRDLLAYYLS